MKDLTCVKETLLELDPTLGSDEEDEGYCAALILLSSLVCGSDAAELTEFTQLPLSFVTAIRERMIAAELWSETTVCLHDWYTKDGFFRTSLFWADVLVAQGLAVRHWAEEAGAYRYFAREFAPEARKRSRTN